MLTNGKRRGRAGRAIAVLALAATLAVGCSGSDKGGSGVGGGQKVDIADSEFTDGTGEAEVDVAVADNTFEPPNLRIDAGSTVVWTNVGRNQHNVQPSTTDAFQGVATTDFAPGQSHSVTFEQAGDYQYYCSIHGTKKGAGQSGVIRVVSPEAS